MKRLLAGLLAPLVLAALIPATSSAQSLTDHLLLYKVRAAPRVPITYTMDLNALSSELDALGCRLRAGARARQMLVPVDKRNVEPAPPSPGIRGAALGADFLCYKIECRAQDDRAPLRRKNQFLEHEVNKMKVRRVCVPVEARTCSAAGRSCAGGETCCDDLLCCSGIPVPPGEEFCGSICPISDREQKQSFESIDTKEVLAKVAELEITSWSYKSEGEDVRHLGPMAQAFRAAFGLGSTDRSIFLVDADGVSLAAIQALNDQLDTVRRENARQRRDLEALELRLKTIELRKTGPGEHLP